MKFKIFLLFLFLLNINSNLIFAYSWRDDNTYNYNSYNYYNDYKSFANLNFKPSFDSNFYFNTREMFNQNKLYDNVRQTWQLNSYKNNSTYSENIAKYVAPSVVLSDYVGNPVKENTAWESFNYEREQYKPQVYSNVILNEEKNPQSFQMLIAEDNWKTRNIVDNLTYNDQNLPQNLRITTSDIDNNRYTQTMTNIEYKENPQVNAYNDLMNLCDRNMNKKEQYLWKDLSKNLEKYDSPAEKVVRAFDLEVIDPQNNKTNIRYENIEWDKKAITSFEATVISPSVISSEDPVILSEAKNLNRFTFNKDNKLDTAIFADVFKGQNPLELAGASSIQIGNAKLPVITKTYNENGLFTSAPSIPLVEGKTTRRQGVDVSSSLSSISQQLNITDKPTEQNRLKTQIFELSQTDIQSTKNVIWNNDLSNAKTEDLKEAVKAIETSIVQKLDNFNKTSPDGLKLKLENNKITTESKITNEQGEPIKNASFVIKNQTPQLVQEKDKPKIFAQPEIKKEPSIFQKINIKFNLVKNIKTFIQETKNKISEGWNKIINIFNFNRNKHPKITIKDTANTYNEKNINTYKNELNKVIPARKISDQKQLQTANKIVSGIDQVSKYTKTISQMEIRQVKNEVEKITTPSYSNNNRNFKKQQRYNIDNKINQMNVISMEMLNTKNFQSQTNLNLDMTNINQPLNINSKTSYKINDSSVINFEYNNKEQQNHWKGNLIINTSQNSHLELSYEKEKYYLRFYMKN